MMKSDAEMAADYWRYTPHVALLALSAPVMALASMRWPFRMRLRSAILTPIVLALALCALLIRPDLRGTDAKAWPLFVRSVTAELRQIIPPGSKLVLVLTHTFSPYQVIVPYDLWRPGDPARSVAVALWFAEHMVEAPGPSARSEGSYLLIHDHDAAMDDIAAKIGVPPPHDEFALYTSRNGAWEKVKSWPIPLSLIERHQ
jgi:hypothetical protein